MYSVFTCQKSILTCSLCLQVEEELQTRHGGFEFEAYVVVACMLVQEGADLHLKNKMGQSPLQRCTSDLAAVVKAFAQKHGSVCAVLTSYNTPIAFNLEPRKMSLLKRCCHLRYMYIYT